MSPTRSRLPLLLLASSVVIGLACKQPIERGLGDAEETGGELVLGDAVAEVTKVRGRGGLVSPQMEPGTFLGEGAQLEAGRRVETPVGTQAELLVGGALVLRVNEDSALLFEPGRKLVVERGEVVARLDVDGDDDPQPFEIAAGDERLLVHRGEAHVRNEGERRHYAVVAGLSELRTGDATVELGPGSSLDIPWLPPDADEPDPTPKPLVSLQPLEDAAWAASFDAAARMAETLPRGVGSLTARRAGSQAQHQSLRLVDQKVMVSISGRIARTEIEQAFHNESGQTMEGIYRFPLPADASISGLSLLVGDQWMDGEMVEKQRGQQIFQQIVDATVPRDPALLHWEQGSVFKLRIFPIPGRGERRIRLSYTQVLPTVGDALRYRYPLGGSGATEAAIDQFELAIRIDREDLEDEQIEGISTPMMRIEPSVGDEFVELVSRTRDFLPTADLGVDIPVSERESRSHVETHLDRDGQAYFMLALRPELDIPVSARPVHYAFVLDRSHSTTPELWTLARGIVGALLDAADPDDRFTVLACDTACDASHAQPVEVSEQNVDAVERFLDGQTIGGASDLGGMLEDGAARLRAERSDVERVVVYLGDGVPTAGALAADELGARLGRTLEGVRVQAVALGSRSDLLVLEALAQRTGGDLLRADARDDRERLVRELQLRARVPVARDVELELPEGMFDVHPARLAALRPGQEVTLIGKLDRPIDADVRLLARGPEGVIAETFPVRLRAERTSGAARHAHLPRTWAQEQIEHLTATAGHSAKNELVALSQRYNVLSRYTALIVLENDRMYREFRVARRQGQTDAWTGRLAGKDGGGEGRAYQPAARADDAAPTPFPDSKSEQTASGETDAAAGPTEPAREAERHDRAFDDDDPDAFASVKAGSDEDADDEGESWGESAGDASASRPSSEAKAAGSAPRPKQAKKKANETAQFDMLDPWDGGGGGGGGGYAYEKRPYHAKPRPTIVIRAADAPSGATLDRIGALRDRRDSAPGERARHRSLVRAAIQAGHADAMAFAAAWAESDPDHSPALLSLADMVAARGDPAAMRAYASAVEVRPFSSSLHERLASAHESKGDYTRACSHRRALVSIDPRPADHHVALARCLHRAGDVAAAREAVHDGEQRARSGSGRLRELLRELEMSPAPGLASIHASPDLKAVLTWSGPADLDIALVDSHGRRLSVMRPEKVRVREESGRETLTLARVTGTVHVEVTRIGAAPGDAPVHAELSIRTPYGARSFGLDIDHASFRIASVRWTDGD